MMMWKQLVVHFLRYKFQKSKLYKSNNNVLKSIMVLILASPIEIYCFARRSHIQNIFCCRRVQFFYITLNKSIGSFITYILQPVNTIFGASPLVYKQIFVFKFNCSSNNCLFIFENSFVFD